VNNAYAFRDLCGLYPAVVFAKAKGPFRWAALSGEASDIARTDQLCWNYSEDEHLSRWIKLAQKRVKFQDCRRASAGWAMAERRQVRIGAE